MIRILVVEDDQNLRDSLSTYLSGEGLEVILAGSVAEARRQIPQNPHLVILDWRLPDGQGIDLVKDWRAQGVSLPIILLTARAEVIDKVLGLEVGANDYLTKPFSPRELLARIHVQLRSRDRVEVADMLRSSGVSLSAARREVHFRGKRVELKKMEFDLLRVLMEKPGQVFSRDELLNQVWGYDSFPTTRTVDTHMLALRTKLHPELFETVRGIGYRFCDQDFTRIGETVCAPVTTANLSCGKLGTSET